MQEVTALAFIDELEKIALNLAGMAQSAGKALGGAAGSLGSVAKGAIQNPGATWGAMSPAAKAGVIGGGALATGLVANKVVGRKASRLNKWTGGRLGQGATGLRGVLSRRREAQAAAQQGGGGLSRGAGGLLGGAAGALR